MEIRRGEGGRGGGVEEQGWVSKGGGGGRIALEKSLIFCSLLLMKMRI